MLLERDMAHVGRLLTSPEGSGEWRGAEWSGSDASPVNESESIGWEVKAKKGYIGARASR